MAKVNPIDGKMRGKLGGRVYSLRYGETVVREYNPAPFNPASKNQVDARSKLKLLSQLSAVCDPIIAIPREGNKSSRNLFTKVNYPLVNFTGDNQSEIASIDLNSVQLTRSSLGLPPVTASLTGTTLTVGLTSTAGVGIDQVVYALLVKGGDFKLRFSGSQIVSTPGSGNTFAGTFDMGTNRVSVVVLAYGIRFNSDDARARFESLEASSAEEVAKVVVERILSNTDFTLTETKGITLNDQG